jgi:hypothetical protein
MCQKLRPDESEGMADVALIANTLLQSKNLFILQWGLSSIKNNSHSTKSLRVIAYFMLNEMQETTVLPTHGLRITNCSEARRIKQ